jgi:hypothetical protein
MVHAQLLYGTSQLRASPIGNCIYRKKQQTPTLSLKTQCVQKVAVHLGYGT